MDNKFYNNLKYLRKSRSLTQQELADVLGISRQGYAKYENNLGEPDISTLIKIANYFSVSIDWLVSGETIEHYSTFENILKNLRKSKNITQRQLAEKINVTHVSISGYESGNRSPDTETLQKIADYFNVSIDSLLGRSSNFINFNLSNPKMSRFYEELRQADDELIDKIITIWNVIKK